MRVIERTPDAQDELRGAGAMIPVVVTEAAIVAVAGTLPLGCISTLYP